ncbi:MAG: radical SAM protein [Candidatus Omnitrophica bacterium]|nr:radical SAM protein [Candidatus Omnitrophota bacterium]
MKILLIQPEYKDTWASPPLGLGYIAAALEGAGHKIVLVDHTLEPVSNEEFKVQLVAYKPDFVGISLMVRALPQVRSLIQQIKEAGDYPIVIGGPQPTIAPEFTLRYTRSDFAVLGEGEQTIVELAAVLASGSKNYHNVPGIAFNDGDKGVVINASREFIKDLDSIAFPAWHHIPPSKYNLQPALTPVKERPIAPLITTRGCPYKCNFCGGPLMWKRSFRMRSAKNIIDEIELLMREYGVKQIFLSDDNFTMQKSHALAMCKEICARKIKILWACPNGIRIDKVDDGLLKAMREAGCYLVGFGIESGSQEILNRAQKQLNLSRVAQVVKMANKHDILTYGFFIIGLLGETKKTIRQTIDFAKKLPLDRAWFNVLVPYPGTEIFDLYSKGKPYNEIEWGKEDATSGMIAKGIHYDGLSGEDLVYWQRRALREFYLTNFRRFFSVIKNMSWGSLKTLMKTSFFKRWLRHKND